MHKRRRIHSNQAPLRFTSGYAVVWRFIRRGQRQDFGASFPTLDQALEWARQIAGQGASLVKVFSRIGTHWTYSSNRPLPSETTRRLRGRGPLQPGEIFITFRSHKRITDQSPIAYVVAQWMGNGDGVFRVLGRYRTLAHAQRAADRFERQARKQSSAKVNPHYRPNPRRGLVRLGRAVELRYDRDIGEKPGFYKHEFTSGPDLYYRPRTNEVVLRG